MKKALVLVFCGILALVSLTGCFSGTATSGTSPSVHQTSTTVKREVWEMNYYIDEFRQPTNKWYVSNRNNFVGTFSNSATDNSQLNVILAVDAEKVTFILYEYGNSKVKNIFSKRQNYTIVMQDVGGTRYEMSGYIPSQGDRLILTDSYRQTVINALKQNGTISFYIYDRDYTIAKYWFKAETGNFKDLIR